MDWTCFICTQDDANLDYVFICTLATLMESGHIHGAMELMHGHVAFPPIFLIGVLPPSQKKYSFSTVNVQHLTVRFI